MSLTLPIPALWAARGLPARSQPRSERRLVRRQMHGQALQAPRRPARVTVAPMGRDGFLSAPIPGQEPWPVNRQPDRIDVRFRSCLRSPVQGLRFFLDSADLRAHRDCISDAHARRHR